LQVSAWGKESLKLEETKELLRHSNVQTTSDIYGGLSLAAKRAAQNRLVNFVHQSGAEKDKPTPKWQEKKGRSSHIGKKPEGQEEGQ
jgi:hypothetical protein